MRDDQVHCRYLEDALFFHLSKIERSLHPVPSGCIDIPTTSRRRHGIFMRVHRTLMLVFFSLRGSFKPVSLLKYLMAIRQLWLVQVERWNSLFI
jgi:hypothetical protein